MHYERLFYLNQDLNFQFSFKSVLGIPIPDKKMIHLLDLKNYMQSTSLFNEAASIGLVKFF